jgi:hypothetical protein
LANYAKSLIETSGFCWYWEVGSAPWEEKVALLLDHIDIRSECRCRNFYKLGCFSLVSYSG